MALLVGVDAGASHTEVAIAQNADAPIVRHTAPGAALHPDRISISVEVVCQAIEAALPTDSTGAAAAIVIGIAGAGRETERQPFERAVRATFAESPHVQVTTDGAIALQSAFSDRPGIVLCAGTGSIAYARDANGTVWRAGGLGWKLGDEGSGYALGRAAIGAAARAIDGRGHGKELADVLLDAIGAETLDDMVRWAQAADHTEVAKLAIIVCNAAAKGEGLANDLVGEAVEDLEDHLTALREHFAADQLIDVAFSGNLLQRGSLVREHLIDSIGDYETELRFVDVEVDPVLGALELAGRTTEC